ncbi:MAG: dihydrodipicolinate synthase family protein, partial [Thermodesulfobacteriota bacterium]|nr:dihydrodipicolinate synthase family protein [Thermodesulfobacteriota bacterium]
MYKRIADACSKPLWLYYSSNWSRPMPPDFVAGLKGYPNIAGVKYSTKNAVDNLKVISLSDDDFQVITAVAAQLYACLCMGVKAHTSSLGSSMPDELINIYEHFQAGRLQESLKAQKRLNEFMAAMPKDARSSNFLMAAEEKYILKLRGICDEYVSTYYKGLSEDNKRLIEDLVRQYEIIP